jgi:Xaa-Pro dipeptidase
MAAPDRDITRRIEALRTEMKNAGMDALLVFSQVLLGEKGGVRYLSNYRLSSRKDYLLLTLSGDPMLVVPTLGQQKVALSTSWVSDIRAGGDTEGMVREIASCVKARSLHTGVIGITGLAASLPYQDYKLFRAALPEAKFVDGSPVFDRVRMAKSPDEVEKVRATTAICDRCYELVLEIFRPGIDEREIVGEVYRLLAREGAEDLLILTAKGPSFPGFISPPGPYRFKDGDLYVFSIEISGPTGYWSQIVRPMSLGEPDPGYRRLFDAGRKALDVGAALLQPGRPVHDVARAVADEVREAGFKTGLWCGHAMGIDLGDGIGLSEEDPAVLRENSVITIHPHVMSLDDRQGLLIGDTFVVMERGGQSLSHTRCELRRI